MNNYMDEAIKEALISVNTKSGGPFGTVVVKDGKIIGRGHNTVLDSHDPTAHGEINAIREACNTIGSHDLSGCILYTTGEPCTMCLCSCKWANIDRVYYGCNIEDNSIIGFRDSEFDKLFNGREKLHDYLIELDRDKCLELFDIYKNSEHELY